jgi:hypothetical protein
MVLGKSKAKRPPGRSGSRWKNLLLVFSFTGLESNGFLLCAIEGVPVSPRNFDPYTRTR